MKRLVKPATLKLIAISYIAKTLLIGIAWLAVPDLPERAAAKVRAAWQHITGAP